MNIKYIDGDATEPIGDGIKIIPHICNNKGLWGSGFVLSLSNKWPNIEQKYRRWYKNKKYFALSSKNNIVIPFELGQVQFIRVKSDIIIANMIAQDGIKSNNYIPIKYQYLEMALYRVKEIAEMIYASIHMPKIGTIRAGGSWEIIESIIDKTLIQNNINVTVYNFKNKWN